MARAEPDEVEAVVSAVKGTEGNRFAVAYPSRDGQFVPSGTTITFSLSEWEGEREPRRGQVVLLGDVEKFAKGWRARRARPVQLDSKKKEEE